MSKAFKNKHESKKKPQMSLKEKRAKKHEKKLHREEHFVDTPLNE